MIIQNEGVLFHKLFYDTHISIKSCILLYKQIIKCSKVNEFTKVFHKIHLYSKKSSSLRQGSLWTTSASLYSDRYLINVFLVNRLLTVDNTASQKDSKSNTICTCGNSWNKMKLIDYMNFISRIHLKYVFMLIQTICEDQRSTRSTYHCQPVLHWALDKRKS